MDGLELNRTVTSGKEVPPPMFALHPFLQQYAAQCFDSDGGEHYAAFAKLLSAIRPLNPITGFLNGDSWRIDLEDAIRHLRSRTDNEEYETQVIRVSADISNLRGLNILLNGQKINGKDANHDASSESDMVLGLTAEIFRHGLESASAMLDPHMKDNCFFYQDGGDEISALMVVRRKRTDTRTIDEMMRHSIKDIEISVRQLAMELNLTEVMHKKYDTDRDRRGYGIAITHSVISDDVVLNGSRSPMLSIMEKMEADINAKKAESPEVKWKRREGEVGHTKRAARHGKGRGERRNAQMPADGIRDGLEYEKGMVVRMHEPCLTKTRESIRHLHSVLVRSEKHLLATQFPFDDVKITKDDIKKASWSWVDPRTERGLRTQKKCDVLGLTGESRELMEKMYAAYEEARSSNGVIYDNPADLVDRYQESKPYFKREPGKKSYMLAISVENFAGLNEEYGHDGCNHVVNEVIAPVRAIAKNMPGSLLLRPQGKGNMYYLFVPQTTPEAVLEEVNALNRDTKSFEKMMGIAELPNPRNPYNPALQGVKLVCAATEMDRINERSGENLIADLHKSIANMKKQTGDEVLPSLSMLARMLERHRKSAIALQ